MNYNIVSYLIGEGFKNVLKNKKSTFAAFIIMFVTMITVGLGIAGGSNITSIINQLENDFPINVYIEDTASQDDIKDMEEQIKSIEYVNNVTYTSKEKALEKERESLGDTANVVLNSYTESNHPFPASFTVTLTDLEKSSEVISILQQLDKVKKDEKGNIDPYQSKFYTFFRKILCYCLTHKKIILSSTVVIFAISIYCMKFISQEFFPPSQRPELVVELTLPEGSSIKATEEQAEKLADVLSEEQDKIDNFAYYTGQGSPRFVLTFDPVLPKDNYAQFVITAKM